MKWRNEYYGRVENLLNEAIENRMRLFVNIP